MCVSVRVRACVCEIRLIYKLDIFCCLSHLIFAKNFHLLAKKWISMQKLVFKIFFYHFLFFCQSIEIVSRVCFKDFQRHVSFQKVVQSFVFSFFSSSPRSVLGRLKEGGCEGRGRGNIFPFPCSGHMASSLFTCWASGSLRQGTHRKGTEWKDEMGEKKRGERVKKRE